MADYSTYTKAELLNIIANQEKELKAKKYGLVWDSEREPEQVVLDCENNLPILKRIKSKEIRTNHNDDNILIEGDNYHALTVLNYTHKEKIDVIYIDPPYNTGNKSWKYNNRYVEKYDNYWHSKWLNMMEKRLNLAKELLKTNGIIVVTIDDFEKANLVLLMDKILGEINRLGIVSIMHNPRGRSDDKYLATSHEYALFYSKDNTVVKTNKLKLTKEQMEQFPLKDEISFYRLLPLKRTGSNSTPDKRPNLYYPIFFDKKTKKISIEALSNINTIKILPIDSTGGKRVWRWGKVSLMERVTTEIIVKENDNKYSVFAKDRIKEGRKPKTIWVEPKYDASSHGTMLLKKIINIQNSFNYPKSLFAVLDTLEICSANKKQAIILDFFAGSGTTGHAVLELNKQDGGNRKFILCTNNENNICTDVTYPRIHNVIKGYKFKGKDKTILFEKKLTWTDINKKIETILEQVNEIIETNKDNFDKIEKEFKNNTLKIIGIKNIDGNKEGLNGNLQYFKTSLIKKTKNRDQVKINLTKKCTEMLCVKENIFNIEIERDDFKIFTSNRKDKFLCVYYNFIEDSFNGFVKELQKLKGKKIIYMFSMENQIDKSIFESLKNFTIEAIPQNILDVYKQLTKMNIPIKPNVIFTDLNKAKTKIFIDKDKDDGARVLRVVLEKLIQKISQNNSINILNDRGKELKISTLNDSLLNQNIITKIEWTENRTYLTIGNNAAHGDYDDYDIKQVRKFYKHIQSLLNNYNV